jgi:hypothetical protein
MSQETGKFMISLFLQEGIGFFAREAPSDDVLWPNQTQSDGISGRISIWSAVEDLNHTLTSRRFSFFSTAAVLDENAVLQTAIIEPAILKNCTMNILHRNLDRTLLGSMIYSR